MSRLQAYVSHQLNPQLPNAATTSIPPEILCRIFLLSLSESPFDDSDAEEEIDQDGDVDMLSDVPTPRRTTPFTLSSVCLHWQATVGGDPKLWSSIYLVASPARAAANAFLIQHCLSRATHGPITLEIDCLDNHWSSETADEALKLLKPVFKIGPRVQTFRTRLPPSCLLLPPAGGDIQDPCFSKLTTLSIVPRFLPDEDDDEGDELDQICLFQHATGLQHLHIRELEFEQLDLHWGHLVKLTANAVYAEDCIQILRLTPHLELCQFEHILFPRRIPSIREPISLPKLHTLHLDMREVSTDREVILPNITAPKLKTLEYIAQHGDKFPTAPFMTFMDRSNCVLEELVILNPQMTAQELQTCLSKTAKSLTLLNLCLRSNLPGAQVVTPALQGEALVALFPRITSCKIQGPINIISQIFTLNASVITQ